jgi:hypothetical protein
VEAAPGTVCQERRRVVLVDRHVDPVRFLILLSGSPAGVRRFTLSIAGRPDYAFPATGPNRPHADSA